ncbi:uncharacterized protein LOC127762958 [Oryza glaberrima]|uniref:Mitochondrial import inner membrane translocase subunit Tim21 n=1 Tax=Oryza barthii TaxID=65489 RepID=A0A0D3FAM4_9ORYZ|nr:uncharacterized protein LOC127762958 [Oryza glaberrima]
MAAAAAAGVRKLAGTLRLLAAGRGSGCIPRARASPCETSFLPHRSFSAAKTGENGGATGGGKRSRIRRIVSIGVISIAGGVALSALNDLAIFHGCSSKAIKKATENQEVVEAIGVPIVRGPWYDASLAVGHRRRSVSCTFPVSGPQGSGIFQFKAIRNGDDGVLSFLRHHDWDILVMEAHLHVPSDDDKQKTLKINLIDCPDHPSRVSDCESIPWEREEQES